MKLFKPWIVEKYGKYFKSDKELVIKYIANYSCQRGRFNIVENLVISPTNLKQAFCWAESPEGHTYWQDIHLHTAPIIRKSC